MPKANRNRPIRASINKDRPNGANKRKAEQAPQPESNVKSHERKLQAAPNGNHSNPQNVQAHSKQPPN